MGALLFARWRELSLMIALASCFFLGRCAQQNATAAKAWKDSTTVARRHAESAEQSAQRAIAASDADKLDLDSARAVWLALRPAPRPIVVHDTLRLPATPPDSARTALDVALAQAAAHSDSQQVAGDNLERACTAYESSCERAKREAAAALAAKDALIGQLEHPPPDPAAARFQPTIGGGYNPFKRWPLLSADASLRLMGAWYLKGDLDLPIAPHASANGKLRVMWRF